MISRARKGAQRGSVAPGRIQDSELMARGSAGVPFAATPPIQNRLFALDPERLLLYREVSPQSRGRLQEFDGLLELRLDGGESALHAG